jgi:hypothetical protein
MRHQWHHPGMHTPKPFGFVTLYKTALPIDYENGEYYQVHFDPEINPTTGKEHYFIREKHGWFDAEQKKLAHLVTTLSPVEGYETKQEALERYDQQVRRRASDGFVHSFWLDPFSEIRKYQKLA